MGMQVCRGSLPAKSSLPSPSGLSQSAAAQRYHKAILKEILSGAHARLGDAVAAAQAAYLESGDSAELLGIYHLLGDPALSLR